MSKLLIVESGDYSDFYYTPLFVDDDFDLNAAMKAFKDDVCPSGQRPKPYTINKSFAAFLSAKFGARVPEPGEIMVVDDPIHYGSWEPSDWSDGPNRYPWPVQNSPDAA